MFANTENRMTLRVLDTAQWQSCAAKLLSISAIILLFGETQKCLYLSQISTDFNSVKKHLFASVLPHLLSTHLTSTFNIWMVQVWPRTFPLCSGDTEVLVPVPRWASLGQHQAYISASLPPGPGLKVQIYKCMSQQLQSRLQYSTVLRME